MSVHGKPHAFITVPIWRFSTKDGVLVESAILLLKSRDVLEIGLSATWTSRPLKVNVLIAPELVLSVTRMRVYPL